MQLRVQSHALYWIDWRCSNDSVCSGLKCMIGIVYTHQGLLCTRQSDIAISFNAFWKVKKIYWAREKEKSWILYKLKKIRKSIELDTTFLAPPLNLLSQLLPLIPHKLHHRLNLFAMRGDQILMTIHNSDPLLRRKVGVINSNHEVHNSRQLIRKPLDNQSVCTECIRSVLCHSR